MDDLGRLLISAVICSSLSQKVLLAERLLSAVSLMPSMSLSDDRRRRSDILDAQQQKSHDLIEGSSSEAVDRKAARILERRGAWPKLRIHRYGTEA
jgi:hypothetical protein